MSSNDEQSAPLLATGTPRSSGAPVSRVSLVLAALAAVGFFAVVATSSNVLSFGGGRGGGGGEVEDSGGRTRRITKSGFDELESTVLDDAERLSSELGHDHLKPECRKEIIAHQRVFVNGLEQMFSNGCGGPQFDPMKLKADILKEEGDNALVSEHCPQNFMDRVFVNTFARVFQWMCKSDKKTLNMVMGFDATVPASDFDADVVDKISLALSSTEGMTTDEVKVRNVISVEQANNVDLTAKLLAKGLKTAKGALPTVVVIVKVTGKDMASSLLAVTHFAHAASQGLIASTIQQQSVSTIKGSVVLGWLPPTVDVPDHFNRFSDYVQAMLGSAVAV